MDEVDELAVECNEIELRGIRHNSEALKNKDSLLAVSYLLRKPTLKCGKKYAIIDEQTEYTYTGK